MRSFLHTTLALLMSELRDFNRSCSLRLEEVTFIVNAVHSSHVLCISTCNSAAKILDVTYVLDLHLLIHFVCYFIFLRTIKPFSKVIYTDHKLLMRNTHKPYCFTSFDLSPAMPRKLKLALFSESFFSLLFIFYRITCK